MPELTFSPNLGKTIWDKVGKIFLATILQVIVLLFLTLFPVVLMEEARDVHIRSRALSPSFSRRRKNDNKSIRKTGNYGFSQAKKTLQFQALFVKPQSMCLVRPIGKSYEITIRFYYFMKMFPSK